MPRYFQLRRTSITGCLAVLLATSVGSLGADTLDSPPDLAGITTTSQPLIVSPTAVLALSDNFKKTLDVQIIPIKYPLQKAQALHELLFGENGYQVRYDSRYTRTAMETLAYGNGNCVSLANLYIAAGRYVGLQAYFQESQAEDWEDRFNDSGYYVLSTHINVLIRLPGHKQLTVEFLEAYMDRDSKNRAISDDEALSQYYNNLGVAELHDGDLHAARQYLEMALHMHDGSALAWSNMGVIEKRSGHLAEAEQAYLTALRHNQDHTTAANNLYVLYMQMDKPKLATRYASIVEKHKKRNPYYLSTLAQEAINKTDYSEAINLLKEAVKIKNDEDHFHFALARAYFLAGKLKRAEQAMKKAYDVAETAGEKQRYRNKLAALHHLSEKGS